MPRSKISIEDAFRALEEQGVRVKRVEDVHDPRDEVVLPQPIAPLRGELDYTVFPPRVKGASVPIPQRKVSPTVQIPLYAKHTISAGESRESYTFGPGICTVPKELEAALLYQDQLARQADERLLETQQRCYLVVRRATAEGHSKNAALRVEQSALDNIGILGDQFIA